MEVNNYSTDHNLPALVGLAKASGRPRRLKSALRDEYVATLATFAWFEGAPIAALRELAHECRDFAYPAGWQIASATELLDHVRFVTVGMLRVDTQHSPAEEVAAGGVVGAHEFRTGTTSRARVVSVTRVEGIAVPFDALRLFEAHVAEAAPEGSRRLVLGLRRSPSAV